MTTTEITDATIATADIADGAVTNAKLATGIDASKITTGTLAGSLVGTGISAGNITTGTLPTAQIAAGSIDNTKLATGIDASKITTGVLPTAVVPASTGVPVGTIIAFAGTAIPANWLECNGSSLSTTTYAILWAAIGNTWGSGGIGSFNLPDLRGTFIRGWDHGSGNDPDASSRTAKYTSGATGDVVGSYQQDDFKSHVHYGGVFNYFTGAAGGTGYVAGASQNTPTLSAGGTETRPKNASVIYIIKTQ